MRTPISPQLAVVVLLLPMGASSQWINYRAPGIPRLADGKPNLSAPPPRTGNGRPDLSGIWMGSDKYAANVALDLKPEDVQPWAEALYQQRLHNLAKDRPTTSCLPAGLPRMNSGFLARIVQTPALLVILYEVNLSPHREIFLDGRALPKDPNPTWFGYSVGRWEGDTLVAETAGFNDLSWLDDDGHPHTDALRITERYRRRDFGHMEYTMTIDDPKAYRRAWTVRMDKELQPDTELIEWICENEKDTPHMVGENKK